MKTPSPDEHKDKKETSERLKRRIDELREEWDRLENNPYRQQNITISIGKVQSQLVALSGERY